MNVDKMLYSLVCCPDCNSELHEHNGAITCEGCQATFALEDGIPLLFSQEILKDPLFHTYKRQYDEHSKECYDFSSKHTKYSATGLLEKLGLHISNYRAARRLQNSSRKYHNYILAGARFVGPTTGLTVLDIGSSEGLLLAELQGNRVAFDLSPLYLKHMVSEDFLRVSGFAEKLPFKNAVFDRVICSAVFEHILKPQMTADEITRVLKPSGKAVITVPCNENPEHLFELQDNGTKDLKIENQPRSDKKKLRP